MFGFRRMYFNDPNRDFMTEEKLKELLSQGNFKIVLIKKIIVLPFKSLDKINRWLEKTFLSAFGLFYVVHAVKE